MKRTVLVVCLAVIAAIAACTGPGPVAPAPGPTPATAKAATAHTFTKIADGIYAAVGTGTVNVGSNSAVIVNDTDVMVVDSHITPAAARTLVDEITTLTDKPVKFLVDTHFHFDHAHGNQVFGPDVQIIGHEFTRDALATGQSLGASFQSFTVDLPAQIDGLRQKVARETNPDEKAKVEQQLKTSTDYSEALKEITPTPPNVTLRTGLTIYRGTREIQLLYLGRGHTGGDVVVYLPKERVVATGDLLTAALSFMGDAYANEWPATLEALKQVDFDWVIPGHGQPYRGKANLENFQKYLEDFWAQASALHAKGISAEEAASQIDMTSHQAAYASITKPGVDIRAVQRAFAVMEGK
ncbi:MAG: MBL fold metallo-hydrolase [Vicinamibacterales bacterium]